MSAARRLVADALAATEVLSPTSYAWFGVRSSPVTAEVEAMMTPESARAHLVYHLQMRLYADFYCSGGPRAAQPAPAISQLPGASAFVQTLCAANAGSGAREPGWTVTGEHDATLVVARHGLTLWVARDDVTSATDIAPGANVSVLMPKELLRLSPGFYMALGDAEFPSDDLPRIVRFYWHLRSDGAAGLIGDLTCELNARGLPFRLKVVSDPTRYSRCDAGVLYILYRDYDTASDIVARVYRRVAAFLRPMTPAFTKRLAPGLALAEDPMDAAQSFGMSRCKLLAEAIALAAEHDVRDPVRRMHAVDQQFTQAGMSLDAAHLNSASTDEYRFPLT